jgi:hypothetical protein
VNFNALYHSVYRYIDHMSAQQWMIVLVVVIGLGLVCMRGFGSRKNY